MAVKVYRQGDVALVPIDEKRLAEIKAKGKILKTRLLRKGENGGLHQLEKDTKAVIYELDGVKYILSEEGVGVVHGEHGRVDAPAGAYEVRVQREISQDRESWVRD